jgi:hypothetical protein
VNHWSPLRFCTLQFCTLRFCNTVVKNLCKYVLSGFLKYITAILTLRLSYILPLAQVASLSSDTRLSSEEPLHIIRNFKALEGTDTDAFLGLVDVSFDGRPTLQIYILEVTFQDH